LKPPYIQNRYQKTRKKTRQIGHREKKKTTEDCFPVSDDPTLVEVANGG